MPTSTTKDYEEYATRRRAQLSPAGRTALAVFSSAYSVGVAVSDARQRCRVTQRQLAAASGVAQADISRIERGVITPTLPTLIRLVEALGARVGIVFDDPVPDAGTSQTGSKAAGSGARISSTKRS